MASTKKKPVAKKKEPKKAVEVQDAPETDSLEDRVAELERKQALLIDAYQFIESETKNVFGLQHMASIARSVYKKLVK